MPAHACLPLRLRCPAQRAPRLPLSAPPQSETLVAVEHRLLMHINRANSLWAEKNEWIAPDLWGAEELDMWKSSSTADAYKNEALEQVKAGRVSRRGDGGGGFDDGGGGDDDEDMWRMG